MDDESVIVEIKLDEELERVLFNIATQVDLSIEDVIKVILALEINRENNDPVKRFGFSS